jgi:ABC-type Mn2+/Zn2+ transport system ATPase subunit
MIHRLYIHNFRCFENFDLAISGLSSVLLIGENGVGKTTVGVVLEIFQQIARGTNRVGELVKPKDRRHSDVPVRFEIEAQLGTQIYKYVLVLELPEHFKELRVQEERLDVDGIVVYSRETSQVNLARLGQQSEAHFRIDWHLVALPIVQHISMDIFKQWLAHMIVIRPVPGLIRGESDYETLYPNTQVTNLGAWFSGLVASAPSIYSKLLNYLQEVMPDLEDIKNPRVGAESRSLNVQFANEQARMTLQLQDLSDGEKCFVVCGLVIAANAAFGPLLCFWDEPENYLAPSEVGLTIMALRRAFKEQGQLIIASHNPQAIDRFSDENTLILRRKSHLEPAIVRRIEDLRESGELKGDLASALTRGDVAG